MKKHSYAILCLAAFTAVPTFGQDNTQQNDPADAVASQVREAQANQNGKTTLSKFDLDFLGGTPNSLVAAIEKAMGRPLNAIVPDHYADIKLPPLKMKSVNVDQLFKALLQSSNVMQGYPSGGGGIGYANVSCGFATEGTPTDDSIWYFIYRGPPEMPKVSRYYLLTPYLDRGLTVDDITTAIQTGWKMMGDSQTPTLSFHKETDLLIAVGDEPHLGTIDAVLRALVPPSPATKKNSDARGREGGFGPQGGQ